MIGGDDAMLIAGYLDNRLDEWEQAAFERRLIHEPRLLQTVIAARVATSGPAIAPEAVPQSVIAAALNLAAQPIPDPRRSEAKPSRPWFFGSPAFAWSLATMAFLVFAGLGTYVAFESDLTSNTADSNQSRESLADDLDRRNDSIFTDPAKTYFDGTEVDD